jgi:hypothetical protein
MVDQPRNRGPWTHRALVWVFGVALGFLIYWLLGFVVNDIATWPGPEYGALEQEMLEPALLSEQHAIERESAKIQAQVVERESKQGLLRDSTESSQKTMNQLLSIHRLGLEKNVEPTEAEQKALAEAEQLFLDNQKKYQELNTELADLHAQQTTLAAHRQALAEKLETARKPILAEFDRLWQRHQYRLALAKLAFLLPLSAIAAWLFLRARRSIYAPLIYAFGIALALKVAVVMHDHFPSRYFKYMLIIVSIAIVLRVLIYLLRMIARPSTDYLLRQYREAYERFFCPICDYPIRRGPLKYVFWSRRTIKKLHFPPQAGDAHDPDEPYTCPACATALFEKCGTCGSVRHSLLPACDHCGNDKTQAVVPAQP